MTTSPIPGEKKKNIPNGGKGRPKGTKTRNPGKKQLAVDAFRSTQTKDWVAEFDYWVSMFRPKLDDIHARLKEAGYAKGWSTVQNWYRQRYPAGAEAARLNSLAYQSAGIDTHGVMELALGQTVNTLNMTMNVLNSLSLDDMPAAELVRLVGPLAKEVRATASKIQELSVMGDSKEIELGGAVAVVEHLLQTFDDNPVILPPLKEACRAALAKLQGE